MFLARWLEHLSEEWNLVETVLWCWAGLRLKLQNCVSGRKGLPASPWAPFQEAVSCFLPRRVLSLGTVRLAQWYIRFSLPWSSSPIPWNHHFTLLFRKHFSYYLAQDSARLRHSRSTRSSRVICCPRPKFMLLMETFNKRKRFWPFHWHSRSNFENLWAVYFWGNTLRY
jgi:hypothetical protein